MNMFALAAGGLLAAGGAYLAFVQKKKTEGMLTELKFMKATPLQELHGTWKSLCDEGMGDGFRDFIETNGAAATDGDLIAPYSGQPCAYYEAAVQNCHSTAIGASGGHSFPQKISGRPDCRIIRSCRRKRNKKKEKNNCSCHEPTCTSHLPVPPLKVNTNSFETY